jgi:hypothetical protein
MYILPQAIESSFVPYRCLHYSQHVTSLRIPRCQSVPAIRQTSAARPELHNHDGTSVTAMRVLWRVVSREYLEDDAIEPQRTIALS